MQASITSPPSPLFYSKSNPDFSKMHSFVPVFLFQTTHFLVNIKPRPFKHRIEHYDLSINDRVNNTISSEPDAIAAVVVVTCSMMILILFPLILCRWSCTSHLSSRNKTQITREIRKCGVYTTSGILPANFFNSIHMMTHGSYLPNSKISAIRLHAWPSP